MLSEAVVFTMAVITDVDASKHLKCKHEGSGSKVGFAIGKLLPSVRCRVQDGARVSFLYPMTSKEVLHSGVVSNPPMFFIQSAEDPSSLTGACTTLCKKSLPRLRNLRLVKYNSGDPYSNVIYLCSQTMFSQPPCDPNRLLFSVKKTRSLKTWHCFS